MRDSAEHPDSIARLESVSKVYHGGGGRVVALDRLTLSIPPGLTVLAGPSGCGKSTLINLLGALDFPTSGTIEVGGIRIDELDETGLDRFRRRSVGIVFQFFHLMPNLTVAENIGLPIAIAGNNPDTESARITELAEKLGIA
ncbi:MAG TPA: ATP-binding cassette domain-containing protein, partial [Bacteroidetes bacterium]|nr:ATP-binding cassette domain-containing protein [Bacteroidota bacterium]